MKLIVQNICKSYTSNLVLDGIDLELVQGQIVGLLGRNGSGKSTLLKIIAGINQPDDGTVNIQAKSLGYLSERNPLYPHMYVLEYLEWVSSIKKVSNPSERIKWIIDKVGLTEVLGKKINQLSKGYRQRLGLAATMLPDPEIIILDEPINGLDPVQITEYRSLIRSVAIDKIIILSSHLIQEIEAICDRVLLLKEGHIIADRVLNEVHKEDKIELFIRLNETFNPNIFDDIKGVKKVRQEKSDTLIIEINDGQKIIEEIFDRVVDVNFKILEMRRIKSSLNELFEE